MHTGSDSGTTETHTMPGVGSIPNVTVVPPPVGIEFMSNELPPEYMFDQGLNYPAVDSYGYLSTAYESPGEWADHHNVFGLDGQDLHYMGLQAESLPYVCYAPGYVYAHPPFNQYTPYGPGAVAGLDGSFVGTQQYLNSPTYQPPISSPAYIPVIVQPRSDFVPTSSMDPFLLGTGASVANRPANASANFTPPQAFVSAAASSQLAMSTTPSVGSDTSQPLNNNQAASMMHGSGTHGHQGVNSSGPTQSTYQFSAERIPFGQNRAKVAASSNRSSGSTNVQPNIYGWAIQDKQTQGPQFKVVANSGGRNPDVLGEQNKGPRKNRSKDQPTSSVVEFAESPLGGASDAQAGCIIISPDQYNKDDFPVDYPDAKFFVIKSYSEDDVHKSVKYNVWSSTPNGNKRLDSAYEDAQRKSVGKSRKCPVFLFFSVNASGQFCGLAEMVGPVDFDKDMDFWQQDKWSGSFPVKWHIIKDVPNANLRHIILENNENKPVTNSRDTQEIPYSAGINMLKIFKTYLLRTSILDDFMFYEERQQKMLEDKFRHLGRSYNASLYLPAVVSRSKPDGKDDQHPRVDENQTSGTEQIARAVVDQTNGASEHSLKSKVKMQDGTVCRPLKTDGKHSGAAVDQSQRTNGKQLTTAISFSPKANGEPPSDSKDLPPIADGTQLTKVIQPPKVDAKLEPVANPPKSDEKHSNLAMNQLPKAERKQPSIAISRKVDGKLSTRQIDQPSKSDANPTRPKDFNGLGNAGPARDQVKTKMLASESSSNKDTESYLVDDGKETNVLTKTGVPSVDPKQGAVRSLDTIELEAIPTDVVKVGSMQIKVDLGESSSRAVSIGIMSTEFKGPGLSKKGTPTDSQCPKK